MSIEAVRGLLRALGRGEIPVETVVDKINSCRWTKDDIKSAFRATPVELARFMKRHGLDVPDAADFFGVTGRTVRRWLQHEPSYDADNDDAPPSKIPVKVSFDVRGISAEARLRLLNIGPYAPKNGETKPNLDSYDCVKNRNHLEPMRANPFGSLPARSKVRDQLNWLAGGGNFEARMMHGAAVYGADGHCFVHDDNVQNFTEERQDYFYRVLGLELVPLFDAFGKLKKSQKKVFYCSNGEEPIARSCAKPVAINVKLRDVEASGDGSIRRIGIMNIDTDSQYFLVGLVRVLTLGTEKYDEVLFSADLEHAHENIIKVVRL